MKYRLTHSNGHFIATIDGKNYVIDTGCPKSISFESGGEVEINGKVFPFIKAFSSAKKEIDSLTNMDVEGLIGMDALTALEGVKFNKDEGYVEFGKIESEGMDTFPLRSTLGQYLTFGLDVNGKDVGVILDTGARIDYMDPSLLDSIVAKSQERDYNPFLGYFETDGHDTVYRLGDREMKTITYGATDILAQYVKELRKVTEISGIVGINAFFQVSPTVTLDFIRNLLILEK